MDRNKVLVIDDDKRVLHALKREIGSFSFRENPEFYYFETALSALDFLKFNSNVSLVITDQRMPQMSGAEFLTIMRKKYPDVSAILLSAYSDIDAITKSIGSGIVSFIHKPWNPAYLMNEISRGIECARLKRLQKNYITKVNRELKASGQFQKRLLSERIPSHDRLDFTVRSEALPPFYCSGDYYKVLKIDRDRMIYILADAGGPGIRAYGKTLILDTLMNEMLSGVEDLRILSPGTLLDQLNRSLNRHWEVTREGGIQCCALMVDFKFMNITVAGGGGIEPFILRSLAQMPLECSGLPLGISEDYEYEETMAEMQSGDRVLMYSDGIGAVQREYGMVQRLLLKSRMKTEFCDSVMDDLNLFLRGKNHSDDMTLLSVKVLDPLSGNTP